jgi:hypothetical protein
MDSGKVKKDTSYTVNDSLRGNEGDIYTRTADPYSFCKILNGSLEVVELYT